MKSELERRYEDEKGIIFWGKNERTLMRFKFGFDDTKAGTTTATEYAHGFWNGAQRRVIVTVGKVDCRVNDKLDLGEFGTARVESVECELLDSTKTELNYCPYNRASKITRITVVGASANV